MCSDQYLYILIGGIKLNFDVSKKKKKTDKHQQRTGIGYLDKI